MSAAARSESIENAASRDRVQFDEELVSLAAAVGETHRAAAPAETPKPRTPRDPHLVPARAPRATRARRSPVAGAIISACMIVGIFAAQLALSILVSEGAYESLALKVEQRDLARVERVLSQNLDKLASPQNLAENAIQLGMVQNVAPATMKLSDGMVQGDLDSVTREASANLVPNSQLDSLPMVDAQGLLTSRDTDNAPEIDVSAAVRWQGKLPAPATR